MEPVRRSGGADALAERLAAAGVSDGAEPWDPREVHVHVCAAGGPWERDHLLFRDYLRAHPAACIRYAEAKRANARRWSDDGWAYTEAKTGVILDILEQAEDWALSTGWARGASTT